MKLRSLMTALLGALLLALTMAPTASLAAPKQAKFFKNIRVSGELSGGGSFSGVVTITEFGYDELTGLWVSGVVQGSATDASGVATDVKQRFSRASATLNESGAGALAVQAQTCEILELDIGPINLDLLGLVVDLSAISLDITAVSGAGNLLGNLLCAVAGLLDPNGFLIDLINTLDDLLGLLEQINDIIG